jgi:hypothetical protein
MQPAVRKCTELLEHDKHAAAAAARAEGYADGLEAGRRETPAPPPPPLPAHHHLAHAVFAPLTGAAKTPAGQRVIVATAIGACLLIIAAGCVSAASVGIPLPAFFGSSNVP